jgi:hypothetical protein
MLTKNQKLLKQLVYGKLVNDEHARAMALLLDEISKGDCAILARFEIFEDTYHQMIHEFQDYCVEQLGLESEALIEDWCGLVLEDQIDILFAGSITPEQSQQCELCQRK